ncbi:hypothetical protein Agub_g4391 [Astrephomene gubernaculifera]|uniref:tRNA-uridine aminocarboxypropyltransferase 1 n=1 Tax=Astrephomene gubernaculifera TaxID=47775 RepID=A0AAD3DM61_9CHLO|nr:hypothetical protein Agub_g4391 [Astrephomene gubernaculifera]
MDETHPAAKLAARRPDWELPQLHSGLQLAPLDVLYTNKERIKCPKCGRSRAHYCYDCLQPLVPFPTVALPFRVSIVTHHEEKASKNTGVQVAILAAGQVDLHSMSAVPADVDVSRCAVLFPCEEALEVGQLQPDSIDRLFIIDSRWKKAGELVRSEQFRGMRAVRLSATRSAFWRFHTRGVAEEGVCTVEALYFLLEAMVQQGKLTDPRFTAPHAFDNLLWYFAYQHQVVQQAAQKRLAQETGAGDQQQQQQGKQAEGGADEDADAGVGTGGKSKQQQQQRQKQQQQQQQQKGQQKPKQQGQQKQQGQGRKGRGQQQGQGGEGQQKEGETEGQGAGPHVIPVEGPAAQEAAVAARDVAPAQAGCAAVAACGGAQQQAAEQEGQQQQQQEQQRQEQQRQAAGEGCSTGDAGEGAETGQVAEEAGAGAGALKGSDAVADSAAGAAEEDGREVENDGGEKEAKRARVL